MGVNFSYPRLGNQNNTSHIKDACKLTSLNRLNESFTHNFRRATLKVIHRLCESYLSELGSGTQNTPFQRPAMDVNEHVIENNGDDKGWTCLCGNDGDVKGMFGVRCFKCTGWFHSGCVGLKNELYMCNEAIKWSCPACAKPKKEDTDREGGEITSTAKKRNPITQRYANMIPNDNMTDDGWAEVENYLLKAELYWWSVVANPVEGDRVTVKGAEGEYELVSWGTDKVHIRRIDQRADYANVVEAFTKDQVQRDCGEFLTEEQIHTATQQLLPCCSSKSPELDLRERIDVARKLLTTEEVLIHAEKDNIKYRRVNEKHPYYVALKKQFTHYATIL